MPESAPRKVTFFLSDEVSDQLQLLVDVTGLDASTIVDRSLEMFFEGQPDAALIQKLRMLDVKGNTPLN